MTQVLLILCISSVLIPFWPFLSAAFVVPEGLAWYKGRGHTRILDVSALASSGFAIPLLDIQASRAPPSTYLWRLSSPRLSSRFSEHFPPRCSSDTAPGTFGNDLEAGLHIFLLVLRFSG